MTPETYQLHAFLEKHKSKNIPQIIEACFLKIRALEMSPSPDSGLMENLKSVVLLLKHLHRPAGMSPEAADCLKRFLAGVMHNDRRARHALEVLEKK